MEDLWGVERPAWVSVDDDGTRRKQGQEQGQGSSAPCHSLLSLSSLLFYVLQFKEQKNGTLFLELEFAHSIMENKHNQ